MSDAQLPNAARRVRGNGGQRNVALDNIRALAEALRGGAG